MPSRMIELDGTLFRTANSKLGCVDLVHVNKPDGEDEFGITTSHNGLLQTSTRYRKYDNDVHGTATVTTVKVMLPASLQPDVWKRHGLTTHDIFDIIVFLPCSFLWLVALVLGIFVSASSVKISHANDRDILLSSKGIVIKKLSRTILQKYKAPLNVSRATLARNSHHIPYIPHYTLPQDTINHLTTLVPLRVCPLSPLATCGNKFFEYNQHRWLPIERSVEGHIYLIRLVTSDTFNSARKEAGFDPRVAIPLAQMPFRFGTAYMTTTECCVVSNARDANSVVIGSYVPDEQHIIKQSKKRMLETCDSHEESNKKQRR